MVKRAEGLAWRRIESETFVVDLRAKVMYGLNPAGGAVWQSIVDDQPLDTVVRRLAMADGRQWPLAEVRASVDAFVRQLAHSGLVELDPAISPAAEPRSSELDGFDGPALIWQEEMVAYAQTSSCLLDPLNCPAGPVT